MMGTFFFRNLNYISITAKLSHYRENMSLFRRKKSGKVFAVKISTMDAELEFSLDYKVRQSSDNIKY